MATIRVARRHFPLTLPAPRPSHHPAAAVRTKTTSAQHIAARHIDHTFEKLMDVYKHYVRVVAVQDLVLASPGESLPLSALSELADRLRLTRGAAYFVRKYPHVFAVACNPEDLRPAIRLTPAAIEISQLEAAAAAALSNAAMERLVRLLSISTSRTLPLRAVFKVWREFGLPDDFEDSVIGRNPGIFRIRDNPQERNTHLVELVSCSPSSSPPFSSAVDVWRNSQLHGENSGNSNLDDGDVRFAFKLQFPPGMLLKKSFKSKVKAWQKLPYTGPYEAFECSGSSRGKAKARAAAEKRAVGIVHEFMSLTVEKLVEVEQISHFRRWFDINLNIRDLFLDHPGIFYLSTKGKRHTVFLREAYDRGRLVEPNPVYEARRKLLDLVMLGRRGMDVTGPVLVGEEEKGGIDRESDSD